MTRLPTQLLLLLRFRLLLFLVYPISLCDSLRPLRLCAKSERAKPAHSVTHMRNRIVSFSQRHAHWPAVRRLTANRAFPREPASRCSPGSSRYTTAS